MQVVDITGFHKVNNLTDTGKDYQLTAYTKSDELVTIQSMFIKSPKTQKTIVVFKTQKLGDSLAEIMNITVPADSTKVINVKQQLPEAFCMLANASAEGTVITLNGVTAKLG